MGFISSFPQKNGMRAWSLSMLWKPWVGDFTV